MEREEPAREWKEERIKEKEGSVAPAWTCRKDNQYEVPPAWPTKCCVWKKRTTPGLKPTFILFQKKPEIERYRKRERRERGINLAASYRVEHHHSKASSLQGNLQNPRIIADQHCSAQRDKSQPIPDSPVDHEG